MMRRLHGVVLFEIAKAWCHLGQRLSEVVLAHGVRPQAGAYLEARGRKRGERGSGHIVADRSGRRFFDLQS
jgi:hypothetical protein